MSAVVTEGYRLGQRGIQTEGTCDRNRNLSDFQCMCQTCSLVVIGEDEHLCLSSKSAERRGVQDSVTVSFEARTPRIRLLLDESVARSGSPSRVRTQELILPVLEIASAGDMIRSRAGPRIGMRNDDVSIMVVSAHRSGPSCCPFLHRLIGHVRTLGEGCSSETSTHLGHPAHGHALTDSVQVEECT